MNLSTIDISTDDLVRRSPEIVSSSLDEALLFMSVSTGRYLMLEGTGRDIWDLIDGKRRVGEIVAELGRTYDVEAETCRRDVLAFMKTLSENGMVEIGG